MITCIFKCVYKLDSKVKSIGLELKSKQGHLKDELPSWSHHNHEEGHEHEVDKEHELWRAQWCSRSWGGYSRSWASQEWLGNFCKGYFRALMVMITHNILLALTIAWMNKGLLWGFRWQVIIRKLIAIIGVWTKEVIMMYGEVSISILTLSKP